MSMTTQPANVLLLAMGVHAGSALRERNVVESGPRLKIALLGSLTIGCICTVLVTAARFPLFHVLHMPQEILDVEKPYFIIRVCTLPIESLFVTCVAMLYSSGKPYQMAMAVSGQCLIKILWSTVGILAYAKKHSCPYRPLISSFDQVLRRPILSWSGFPGHVSVRYSCCSSVHAAAQQEQIRDHTCVPVEDFGKTYSKVHCFEDDQWIRGSAWLVRVRPKLTARKLLLTILALRFVLFCLCAKSGTPQLASVRVFQR
jgi:hypothetical protein